MKAGLGWLIAISIVAAGAVRFSESQADNWARTKATKNICEAAGNYLETGSLREAYETIEAGLVRSGFADACVAVVDNGRSVSTGCLDAKISYETLVCRADGNTGVKAEIHFPTTPWTFGPFAMLCVTIALGLLAIRFALGELSRRILQQLSEEFRSRLTGQAASPTEVGRVGKLVQSFLETSGVAGEVRSKALLFEAQLKAFESRIREESERYARAELEAARSEENLEKVRQIRHNIRSPLSSLSALQESLAGDELSYRTITSAIKRIEVMTDELDEIDQTVDQLRVTVVEVELEGAASILKKKFRTGKQVDLSLNYDSKSLCVTNAVPEVLRSVFENILENAFDAVGVGGRITVTVLSRSSQCEVIFEDDGQGVSEDIIPHLFARGATFGKVNGTGLGLYHARRNLRTWGGDVRCEYVERGARFVVSLPKLQVGVPFIGLRHLHDVFVIDDDPSVSEVLTKCGLRVTGSVKSMGEGRESLRIRREANVVTLVDYRLGDGQFGTELLRETPARQQCVLCTNDYDDPEIIEKAKALGIRVLPKPLCFASV